MSNETKTITANDMAEHIKGLLKKTTVGISQEIENGEFDFYLPGGKTFRIAITEV